jgi:DNA-binding NarL/FixJ family response regulator
MASDFHQSSFPWAEEDVSAFGLDLHLPIQHSVLVVDDHDVVRAALESKILSSGELRLIGAAATLAEALQVIRAHTPDLVITDMGLPDSTGLDTVRSIVQAQAGRATLVVSEYPEKMYAEAVLSIGAGGYLSKEHAWANVLTAAKAAVRGERWVSDEVRAQLVDRAFHRTRPSARGSAEAVSLSPRELDVMEQIKAGKTSKEIAHRLGISPRTVELHRANIKRKLHLRTGVEVVAFAFKSV